MKETKKIRMNLIKDSIKKVYKDEGENHKYNGLGCCKISQEKVEEIKQKTK